LESDCFDGVSLAWFEVDTSAANKIVQANTR
jgi:hypothetical protein